ncbi:MAG: ATP-binding protein [Pseudomonadota bacterium]
MNLQPTAVSEQISGALPLTRPASVSTSDADFRWRALNALALFRLLMAVLLMAVFISSERPRFFGDNYPNLFLTSLLIWFVGGVVGAIAGSRRVMPLQTLGEIVLFFDIMLICLMALASGGTASGLPGLCLLFVAAGGFILNPLMALFFAALGTVLILGQQAFLHATGSVALLEYPAAGLLSAMLFIVVLAVVPVTRRLAASEALARQQTTDIANLAELNRYVVQHLREAIVVLDGDDNVRLLNDAASRHLGIGLDTINQPLSIHSQALTHHVKSWRRGSDHDPSEQTTMPGLDGSRLQVHIAPFGDKQREDTALMLFLEDISVLAERVQQGKLASLGRLSASIAHEIRNPIGAMSHAAQLMAEQTEGGELAKLSSIIERNAGRVSDLVEDIMQMSRRDRSRPQKLALHSWIATFVPDYAQSLPDDTIRIVGDAEPVEIVFDPGHLRQVLRNLLDNAVRHADASPAAPVLIRWGRAGSTGRPYLELQDHGPGVSAEIEENIFEPFFTQHDAGTGLGLYLCRELCELNRANLTYRRSAEGGSIMHIVFADPERWSGVG